MAFWSKKRLDDKLIQYFNDKGISYEIETEEAQRFKFELCFQEGGFILYPYITVDEELISFNVNVSQPGLKGFNYEKLNGFNAQSKFFKAYLTDTGIHWYHLFRIQIFKYRGDIPDFGFSSR